MHIYVAREIDETAEGTKADAAANVAELEKLTSAFNGNRVRKQLLLVMEYEIPNEHSKACTKVLRQAGCSVHRLGNDRDTVHEIPDDNGAA